MPTTPIDDSTVPAVHAPPAFSANAETEEGAIRGLLEAIHGVVLNLVQRINGRLSLGNAKHGTKAGNLDAQWLTAFFDGQVDVAVPHGLGRVPVAALKTIATKVPDDDNSEPDIVPTQDLSWTQDVVYLTKRNTGRHTVAFLVF